MSKLTSLAKETAVYGISSIVGRFFELSIGPSLYHRIGSQEWGIRCRHQYLLL